MRKYTTDELKELTTELNKLRSEMLHKQLSGAEVSEALGVYGFPINSTFRAIMANHHILVRTGRKWMFSAEPIHYMTYQHAYCEYRKVQARYLHNSKPRAVRAAEKQNAEAAKKVQDDDLEAQIQRAIKLLKDQGDRFQIIERIVVVQEREL